MKKILIIILLSFLLSNTVFAQSDFSSEEIDEIKEVLTDYYQVYETKNFIELDKYLADELPQYISLTNTTPKAVIKNAEKFFANKNNIVYQPYFDKMELNYDKNGNIVAKFGILLTWEVTDSNIRNHEEMNRRSVNVLTRVILDQDKKITNYYEDKIIRPQYRLTRDSKAYLVTKEPQADVEFIELKESNIVIDDFTIKASNTTNSSWTYFSRQVIYEDNKYLVDHYAYYEDNKSYDYYLELIDQGFATEDKKYFDLTKNPTDWQLSFSGEDEQIVTGLSKGKVGLDLSDFKYHIIGYSLVLAFILLIIIFIVYVFLKRAKEKDMFDL